MGCVVPKQSHVIICPNYLDRHLSPVAKKQLRLAKIFKAAMTVAYDDMFDNPWKIPFYTLPLFGMGSAIMVATIVLHCFGTSQKSKAFKNTISGAFNNAVRYDLYKDCYYMGEQGTVSVSPKKLSIHCTKWWGRYLSNKVREKVDGMDKGVCKAIMYKHVVNRLPHPMIGS